MKKILALLLALVMVLGLAACGSKNEPAPAEPEKTTETPAPAEEKTEEPAPAEEQPAATGSVYYLNFSPRLIRLGRIWPRPTPRRPACR